MKLIKVITQVKIYNFEENVKIIKQATYAANKTLETVSIFVLDWASAMSSTKPPSVRGQERCFIQEYSKQNSEQTYKCPRKQICRQNQANQ